MDEIVEMHFNDGSVAYTEPLTEEQMDAIENFLIDVIKVRVNVKC